MVTTQWFNQTQDWECRKKQRWFYNHITLYWTGQLVKIEGEIILINIYFWVQGVQNIIIVIK